jgi:Aldehyde dehydrogenase family
VTGILRSVDPATGKQFVSYPAFSAAEIDAALAAALADVHAGMPVYDEETFGPVAALIQVADDNEAIRVAYDTPYGLVPRSGPRISTGACGWPGRSSPAPSSSTRWSRPTPGCRSAASSAVATDGSCPLPGYESSPTCGPTGSAAPPPPRRAPR